MAEKKRRPFGCCRQGAAFAQRAAAGDLLLIPPYSLHSGRILTGEAFSHFCFCFDLALLKEADFSRQLESGYLDVTRVVRGDGPAGRALFDTAQCIYTHCVGPSRLFLARVVESRVRGSVSKTLFDAPHGPAACGRERLPAPSSAPAGHLSPA